MAQRDRDLIPILPPECHPLLGSQANQTSTHNGCSYYTTWCEDQLPNTVKAEQLNKCYWTWTSKLLRFYFEVVPLKQSWQLIWIWLSDWRLACLQVYWLSRSMVGPQILYTIKSGAHINIFSMHPHLCTNHVHAWMYRVSTSLFLVAKFWTCSKLSDHIQNFFSTKIRNLTNPKIRNVRKSPPLSEIPS